MVLEKFKIFGLFYFKENKSPPKNNSKSIIYNNITRQREIFSFNQIKKNNSFFYRINSHFIKFFIIRYILFILPIKAVSDINPENYIILKIDFRGEQQIFSDEYDLDKCKPYRIYIDDIAQVLRKKKLLVKSKDRIIKIEWVNSCQNLTYMFANLQNIESIELYNMIHPSGVNMSYMFYNCQKLQSFSFNGSKTNYEIKDVTKMFYNCLSLISVSFQNSYLTNNINMSYMFYNCQKINEIKFAYPMKVNDMRKMFYNCFSLKSIDLTKFSQTLNTNHNVNMSYLFYNCFNL